MRRIAGFDDRRSTGGGRGRGRGLGPICPAACGGEAAWLGSDIEVLAPASLLALINQCNGSQVLRPPVPLLREQLSDYPELAEIKGQETPTGARDRRRRQSQPFYVWDLETYKSCGFLPVLAHITVL